MSTYDLYNPRPHHCQTLNTTAAAALPDLLTARIPAQWLATIQTVVLDEVWASEVDVKILRRDGVLKGVRSVEVHLMPTTACWVAATEGKGWLSRWTENLWEGRTIGCGARSGNVAGVDIGDSHLAPERHLTVKWIAARFSSLLGNREKVRSLENTDATMSLELLVRQPVHVVKGNVMCERVVSLDHLLDRVCLQLNCLLG